MLKQYMWVANLVVIFFCSYFAAKIVNVYVGRALEVHRAIGVMKTAEKSSPVRETRSRPDYNVIIERDIFDSSEEAPPPEDGQATGDGEPGKEPDYVPGQDAVKTALPVKVFSVLVVGAGTDNRSSATISMDGKEVDVYAVRDRKTFSPGVVLVQVKPSRVEFINKNRLEYASLLEEGAGSIFKPPEDKGPVAEKEAEKPTETIIAKEEGKFLIDQTEIDNALTNLDRLYTEIRAVPNFQDGRVTGLKILSVKPGSVFAKLGIKRGDILSRINGIELDVKRGFDIFGQLKDQKKFTLDLVRKGTSNTFEYEVR